jgi:FixJ family two-component response regulator
MSKKTILLVDDEQSICISISWALEQNGFAVTTAGNGEEAIAHLQTGPFDLVITDMIMDKVDGFAVLQQAKRLYPEIEVIMLTGYGNVGSAVRALKMGAADFLQKPCDIDDLLNKTTRSLERQDLIAKLRKQNEQLTGEIAARKIAEYKLEQSHANLERQVAERTAELSRTVEEMKGLVDRLLVQEKELQQKNQELQDMNAALNVMLKRRDQEHSEIRNEIAKKAIKTVLPLLKKAQTKATGTGPEFLRTAQANLLDIFAQHPSGGALAIAGLAPRELQIVHYIRQNKSSKEIAELLDLSLRTVESYRENIRKKLNLTRQKKNLKKILLSLP